MDNLFHSGHFWCQRRYHWLDVGQKLELIVPAIDFSKESQKEIAMLAFPDSNSFSDT